MTTFYRLKEDGTILDYTEIAIIKDEEGNAINVPAFIKELYTETERKIIKLTDGSFAFEDTVNLAEEERKRKEKEFNDAKQAKLYEAGATFAQERDKVRFIQLDENRYYGFDCASEDITNFMARWSPLAMMGGGESDYKVWFNETEKGLVKLSLADYNLVYKVVSDSQLEAYAWYEKIKAEIMACTTIEELEEIKWGEE